MVDQSASIPSLYPSNLTGIHWTIRDVDGRNRSVKPWARPPAGLSSMPTEQPTKRPPSTSIGTGGKSGDETRGVGTIWSVRQLCVGVSRLASTLGWPVRRVVQPLRWWLSGDTDAIWLDRYGEDADRPFFHGLAEQLLTDRSAEYQS